MVIYQAQQKCDDPLITREDQETRDHCRDEQISHFDLSVPGYLYRLQ